MVDPRSRSPFCRSTRSRLYHLRSPSCSFPLWLDAFLRVLCDLLFKSSPNFWPRHLLTDGHCPPDHFHLESISESREQLFACALLVVHVGVDDALAGVPVVVGAVAQATSERQLVDIAAASGVFCKSLIQSAVQLILA